MKQNTKSIIESILYAKGEEVEISLLASVLQISETEVEETITNMQEEYKKEERGIEIIRLNNSVQLCTKQCNYEYISYIFDNRNKLSLSTVALEVLSIICYNPKITRAEVEAIRGINSDNTIYRLLEFNLIEEAGKTDAPGKPMGFRTTNEFLRVFGYENLKQLPEFPTLIENI